MLHQYTRHTLPAKLSHTHLHTFIRIKARTLFFFIKKRVFFYYQGEKREKKKSWMNNMSSLLFSLSLSIMISFLVVSTGTGTSELLGFTTMRISKIKYDSIEQGISLVSFLAASST